ncbi:MAG: hypothetical protein IJM30_12730 [Thermoguttaceae bacterium]|nr:hypothetical protein [Thermoguttaceae bacterium]
MKRLTQIVLPSILASLTLWTSALLSAEPSLRETIRQVSESTTVLPLDVYAGTTNEEFRDWDCRYDLTYGQFRPNCVLNLTARAATAKEVLESLERLSEASPKEKALTCAALIAFVDERRAEEIARESGAPIARPALLAPNPDQADVRPFNDEEKQRALRLLEKELDDQSAAFPKIAKGDFQLSGEWRENLREEFANYLSRPRFDRPITALGACRDLYSFSGASALNNYPDSFDQWNGESKRLPMLFLCSVALVQASFERSQLYNANYFEENPNVKKRVGDPIPTERELVAERFSQSQTSVPEGEIGVFGLMGEAVIMEAFAKTQYVASRSGFDDSKEPICGNSSDKDVLVSSVVKKAIDALTAN